MRDKYWTGRIGGWNQKGKTMDNILVNVSGWYSIFHQGEDYNCGMVSSWGLLIVSGFTIIGWYFLSTLDSKEC